jgi:hypothetical protein
LIERAVQRRFKAESLNGNTLGTTTATDRLRDVPFVTATPGPRCHNGIKSTARRKKRMKKCR